MSLSVALVHKYSVPSLPVLCVQARREAGAFHAWILIGTEHGPRRALTKLVDFLRPWLIRFQQQKISVSILRLNGEVYEKVGDSGDADVRAEPLPVPHVDETPQVWAPAGARPARLPENSLGCGDQGAAPLPAR